MKKQYLVASFVISSLLVPVLANAATVDEIKAQIQSLLNQITALQVQLNSLTSDISTTISTSSNACPNLYRALSRGSRGTDVTQLQKFLISQNLLAADSATGFFGAMTEAAVQSWQSKNGIASSGTPATTGYGAVGPKTRTALTKCTASVNTVSPTYTYAAPSDTLPTPTVPTVPTTPTAPTTQTNPTTTVSCTPLAPQTQMISCPVGQTGSITQTRTSGCATGATSPTWGAWATTENTCTVVQSQETPVTNSGCYSWSAQIPLGQAVASYPCVEIQPGTWTLTKPVTMPSNHTLRGSSRNASILKAVSPWPISCCDAVVQSVNSTGVSLSQFTIDAANVSTLGVAARGITMDSMNVRNAKCDGVTIAGAGMEIKNSLIELNGKNCPNTPPGAGIYADGVAQMYSPIISGNTIRLNGGPGIDINGVWGGSVSNNTITNNGSWAGVSLYGASKWNIENNTISQPSTDDVQPYHPYCRGGPSGQHSAGLFLCGDTDANNMVTANNTIRNNHISGWYGILSIGADETQQYLVPRFNSFLSNDVFGSTHGCADDFSPGQWMDGDNTWSGNNCSGVSNSGPAFF